MRYMGRTRGRYRASDSITGNWSQGQSLALDFNRVTVPLKNGAQTRYAIRYRRDWMGNLDTGAIPLRVVFHIVNTEDGLTATLDSPDQGMKGMPVTSMPAQARSLKIEAKQIGGVFEGKVAADRSSIDGKWTQGRGTMPLLLKRVKTNRSWNESGHRIQPSHIPTARRKSSTKIQSRR